MLGPFLSEKPFPGPKTPMVPALSAVAWTREAVAVDGVGVEGAGIVGGAIVVDAAGVVPTTLAVVAIDGAAVTGAGATEIFGNGIGADITGAVGAVPMLGGVMSGVVVDKIGVVDDKTYRSRVTGEVGDCPRIADESPAAWAYAKSGVEGASAAVNGFKVMLSVLLWPPERATVCSDARWLPFWSAMPTAAVMLVRLDAHGFAMVTETTGLLPTTNVGSAPDAEVQQMPTGDTCNEEIVRGKLLESCFDWLSIRDTVYLPLAIVGIWNERLEVLRLAGTAPVRAFN